MKTIIDFIEHPVKQGTPEWEAIRVGKITGSTLCDLMPCATDIKKGIMNKFTKGHYTILLKVAGEILTGLSSDGDFSSWSMDWGTEQEPFARDALSQYLGMTVAESGFFTRSDLPMCGCSPDGIAGDMEAAVEIKCPNSHTHLSYWLNSDSLWDAYRWQITGHCLFTGIDTGYLCSFDPRMPPDKRLVVCEPPESFEEDIEKLRLRLVESCAMIEEWCS